MDSPRPSSSSNPAGLAGPVNDVGASRTDSPSLTDPNGLAWPDPQGLPFLPAPDCATRWLLRACAEAQYLFVRQHHPRHQSVYSFASQMLSPLSDRHMAQIRESLTDLSPGASEWDSADPPVVAAFQSALDREQEMRSQKTQRQNHWNAALSDCGLPTLNNPALFDELDAAAGIRNRNKRKTSVEALLRNPQATSLTSALKVSSPDVLEKRLSRPDFRKTYPDIAAVLTSLLSRCHGTALPRSDSSGSSPGSSTSVDSTGRPADQPTHDSTETGPSASVHPLSPSGSTVRGDIDGNAPALSPAASVTTLPTPTEIITAFTQRLPEGGDKQTRQRAVRRALYQTGTAEIGILASHINLNNRQFLRPTTGPSRQRTLALVPEVFIRMTDQLGSAGALRIDELLAAGDLLLATDDDSQRGIAFRLPLVCGLYARLHLLHKYRVQTRQNSNWVTEGQGLLHFNFLHTITGLGEIPDLAMPLQNAFCECLLDAGRQLSFESTLDTVWAGSDAIRRRVRERARQLARDVAFLGMALATEARFSALISLLSVSLVHAKLIIKDPLRRQLASEVLIHFIEGLMGELTPFKP